MSEPAHEARPGSYWSEAEDEIAAKATSAIEAVRLLRSLLGSERSYDAVTARRDKLYVRSQDARSAILTPEQSRRHLEALLQELRSTRAA